MFSNEERDRYIGSQAVSNLGRLIRIVQDKSRGLLKLSYPMEHGVVQNWDDMEAVWRHCFDELKVNPREHPILLTEPPLNPISNRIKTAQMFFENFQVPKIFFHPSSVLSLYARGLTTGVVLDVGDGVSSATAIYDGFSIQSATRRIDLGGRDITKQLVLLLQRSGYSFRTTAEF